MRRPLLPTASQGCRCRYQAAASSDERDFESEIFGKEQLHLSESTLQTQLTRIMQNNAESNTQNSLNNRIPKLQGHKPS